jgi:hypothetical protein
MTICVSAIATDNGKESIVFSTDHMVSVGDLGQFEKEIKKYKILNKNNIVAMLSGQMLLFDRILEGTNDFYDFYKIKGKIIENMAKIRKEIIKKEVYDLFGIDENYIKTILSNPIQNPFVQRILETVSNFSLQTSILLVGFDNEGKAQISEIDEKSYADYRDIHFHAIGSGSTQALNTLLFQKHCKSKDLKTAIYNVYKAKRNAEVVVGVGKETEVIILNKEGFQELKEDKIIKLSNIYDLELNYGVTHQDLNTILDLNNNNKREEFFNVH